MSKTYTNATVKEANTDRLLELWSSFSSTGLFTLEIDWTYGLSHFYHLKGTTITVHAYSDGKDHYDMQILNGSGRAMTKGEFWDAVPKEHQKILAYHLDQIIV